MLLQRFKIHFNHRVLFSYLYKINILLILALMVLIAGLFFISDSFAAGFSLNTSIPKKPYNIPSGNLGKALATYSAQAGVVLVFDPLLTEGKQSSGLKGEYGLNEGFATLLKGSGLEVAGDGNGEYSLKRAKVVVDDSKNLPEEISLREIAVRAKRFYEVGPLPGLGLTKEEIPGNVQSITAQDIKEAHSLSITELMNRKLQSVTVNDYQGNPFQMDVQYRGFTAGPQIGTPQGLSVFFDGIRVNEPFGDVVNWDMIPTIAISSLDVFPGSNPIFGLNTLGGAITIKTKDGFNYTGTSAEVLTGSYGRKYLQADGGWNNGTVALYGGANIYMEDGWRENSPSRVNQLFGKASYRGDKLDLSLSTLLVQTDLTGNGLVPSEMYKQDRNGVFTSPDTTKNDLQQFQLSGSYFVNDEFSITGQAYRRNSDRRQKGSDVMRDYSNELFAKRRPSKTEPFTCFYPSTNGQGVPDYIVVPVEYTQTDPANLNAEFQNTQFYQDFANGTLDINNYSNLINTGLSPQVLAAYRYAFEENRNFLEKNVYNRNNTEPPFTGPNDPNFFNEPTYFTTFDSLRAYSFSFGGIQYSEADTFFTRDPVTNAVIKNYIMPLSPVNQTACSQAQQGSYELTDPVTGNPLLVDGVGLDQPGYIPGTPTAIITDNQIDQVIDGASMQFNWNLGKHKFMVGASIDSATAKYTNEQRLGFLDANRKAYLDPEQAHPQFAGALVPLVNNNFDGSNITKSVYFSETWSPVETLHLSASGRYNMTHAKNTIAARSGLFAYSIADLIAVPDNYNICTDTDGNGTVTDSDCAGIPANYRPLRLNNALNPAETEKFSYYSFNPSLGASWQAKENLNLYANFAQGARTPSVIELGCAFDKTPTLAAGGLYIPKSLAENRQCTLPTTLSGDPYLPQIKATTYDVGMRGTIGTGMQWNLGAYQTDLKDDIYFVAVGNGQGFFDSIGDTRRRGLEAGFSGKQDKWQFGVNYSLTEATFQNDFLMISEDNSSAVYSEAYGRGLITVKKGSRMPGNALQNLNANVRYELTSKWTVGISAVMHSDSFVRGNENNEHEQGVSKVSVGANGNRLLPPTTNPGTVPGYAVFNLQSSYKLNKEWTATLLVNNVFDREYFSAGRLGNNPFSPSIFGAIGPDGYNHNSGDWRSTNFIAPGAPRGIWMSLRYEFDVTK